MRARSISFGSMFAWIPSTFRLVLNHIGGMATGTLLTLLAMILCYLPLFGWMANAVMGKGMAGLVTVQQESTYWVLYGISMLLALLLMSAILSGWMRLCAAADRGEAVSGMQVFAVFGDRARWLQVLLLSVLVGVVCVAFGGVLYLLFGDAFRAIVAMQEAQNAAILGGASPPPPNMAALGQIFLLYALALPFFIVMQTAYFVGVADISLAGSPAPRAFGDALLGVLRNLLKLVLFGICVVVLFIVAFMLIGVVLMLLVVALSMVSQVLGAIVGVLLYLGFLLVFYPLMFAGNYFMWKDMLGGEVPADANAVAI